MAYYALAQLALVGIAALMLAFAAGGAIAILRRRRNRQR
jgi:hypothetical protein